MRLRPFPPVVHPTCERRWGIPGRSGSSGRGRPSERAPRRGRDSPPSGRSIPASEPWIPASAPIDPRLRGQTPRLRGSTPRLGGQTPRLGGQTPRLRGESPGLRTEEQPWGSSFRSGGGQGSRLLPGRRPRRGPCSSRGAPARVGHDGHEEALLGDAGTDRLPAVFRRRHQRGRVGELPDRVGVQRRRRRVLERAPERRRGGGVRASITPTSRQH